MEKSLKFGKVNINQIMVPINQVFTLDANLIIKDALDDIIESGYSRIPVYKDQANNITGIVLVKNILKELKENNGIRKLDDISIEPPIISPLTHADNLLEYFKNKHEQFGLVKENNKIIGIVSIEDILEEIVGEITDESDITPMKFLIVNKNKIIAHPLTDISAINSYFNKNIEVGENTVTLNDLFNKKLKIKKLNSIFVINNLEFRIREIDKNGMIELITISKKTFDDYLTHAVKSLIPIK